ncbi:MAG: zinc-binding dehydrogenase [Clostridiales bacterium]
MDKSMKGAILPGNSTVELKSFPIPKPSNSEILIKVKSSTICGSDIRCIYREHLGKGAECYIPSIIAGHEPCGIIVEIGSNCRRFNVGDRVIVYHISGCGVCNDCRRGYMISCTSNYRRAYGWQRDGGMAEYLLTEEKDLVFLPNELSYSDGAQIACGFGTVYEGLEKININGNDSVLITGLGPLGLATAMLSKALGANKIFGIEVIDERIKIAKSLNLFDNILKSNSDNVDEIKSLTFGNGVEKSVDCSANDKARLTCIQATRKWGKILFLGEGGNVSFKPSEDIIHDQKTIFGSWVTNIWRMEELVEKIIRWNIHPEDLITHRFSLDNISKAYSLMESGNCGKVAVCFDEELK